MKTTDVSGEPCDSKVLAPLPARKSLLLTTAETSNSLTASPRRLLPLKFDRYEVRCREDGSIFRLGQGKTSSSYKAFDLDLRMPVVLKVIRHEFLEDEQARKQFLWEARSAALLRHPNVATIYRLGEEDGMCFYAREFIEGETLNAKVNRDGPLAVTEALNVALQMAQALVAFKKMNLVHRDIKPSNLMIAQEGAIKIIDFRFTKSDPNGAGEGLELSTLSGFVGTPDYASPEQLNEHPVDIAADIYSLGVTLWFILTGRPPFRGPMAQVMAEHLQSSPPFDELSDFPRCVVSLLAHMLEKEPAKRPLSPTHLVEEIKQCVTAVKAEEPQIASINLTGPIPIPELRKLSATREPAPQRPARQFFFAEVLIGATIAVIIYLILSRPVEPPSPASPSESTLARTSVRMAAQQEPAAPKGSFE
jgi:serine/threonine protein kinase